MTSESQTTSAGATSASSDVSGTEAFVSMNPMSGCVERLSSRTPSRSTSTPPKAFAGTRS